MVKWILIILTVLVVYGIWVSVLKVTKNTRWDPFQEERARQQKREREGAEMGPW